MYLLNIFKCNLFKIFKCTFKIFLFSANLNLQFVIVNFLHIFKMQVKCIFYFHI